ncbi:MAG: hypothetical protein NT004_01705 [Bacteroidetes bacterium]|nr:hypothetical protein [Bacteroidota bacterium]
MKYLPQICGDYFIFSPQGSKLSKKEDALTGIDPGVWFYHKSDKENCPDILMSYSFDDGLLSIFINFTGLKMEMNIYH